MFVAKEAHSVSIFFSCFKQKRFVPLVSKNICRRHSNEMIKAVSFGSETFILYEYKWDIHCWYFSSFLKELSGYQKDRVLIIL